MGIESSCDETGVAIYDSEMGLMANVLYSQIGSHQKYGGIVPELASRDHVKYMVSLVNEALAQAEMKKNALNAIAYTAGPGLIGALLSGACFAKSLAMGLGISALAVHHLEAHLLAAKLDNPRLDFPFLVLLVSGGHTQLIEALSLGNYTILGETQDDAVGEAFDKTAKLMGIPYPGGSTLAALADAFSVENQASILPDFPCPMTKKPGLDLSFSGLKTHALTVWNTLDKGALARQKVAYAFQKAVVTTLDIKCKRALDKTGLKNLVVAGGVGANQALRHRLVSLMITQGGEVFFPRLEFCTDNGAMVAYTGYLHLLQGKKDDSLAIEVKARWPF